MFSSRLVGDMGQHTLVHVCLVSCHAKIFSRCPDFLFPHTAHESSSGSLIVRISMDSHSHLLLSFFLGGGVTFKRIFIESAGIPGHIVTVCHREDAKRDPCPCGCVSSCPLCPVMSPWYISTL